MLRLYMICTFVFVQSLPLKKSVEICSNFFQVKDCYYFSCLDSIYQCGDGNFLVQFSYPFCNALLEQTYQSLTSSGQSWANTSQICVMQEIEYFLRTNSRSTCTEIDHFMLEKYPICLTQSHPTLSICSIICNNLEVFLQIFDNWNLQNFNIKRFFLKISLLCPEESQMEYVIHFEQATIRTILWSLCLDSLKSKFINFHPNELMIDVNSNPGLFDQKIDYENN